MLTSGQKIKYLVDSFLHVGQKVQCTFCGSTDCKVVDRKYLVTTLMECQHCHLYFRFPVDAKTTNHDFYQTEYQEQDQITTDLPDREQLKEIMDAGFTQGNKSGARFLDLFKKLFPEKKTLSIIDYGCNWGYFSWQFQQAGHLVQGYEISMSRAAFGVEQLGVNIVTSEKDLFGGVDIFFSSHVIEHHPDLPSMINLAKRLLAPGGYFVAISPNGSAAYQQKNPDGFHHAWGKVHPNFLSATFYQYIFSDFPYYIGSSPIETGKTGPLHAGEHIVDRLDGDELMVITKLR